MSRPTDEKMRRVPETEVRETPEAPEARADDSRHDGHDAHDDDLDTLSLFAIISAVRRSGTWVVPDRIDVLSVLGEATLDFTKADLPESGMVEIRCLAILGAVKILVPPGSEVEMEGLPLLGGFEHKSRSRRKASEVVREWVTGEPRPEAFPDDEPPLFHVTGFAFLGSVEVISS